MEGEEKKTEGTAATKQDTPKTQQGQASKPKQNIRKRRNNKSAAERKAQKAKANAEKAAAAARKAGQIDDDADLTDALTADETVAENNEPVCEEKSQESVQAVTAAPADNAEKTENKRDDKAEPEEDNHDKAEPEKEEAISAEKNPEDKATEPEQAASDEKTSEDDSEATETADDEKPVLADDESELSEEERRHKADLTRTVQVSIEQILARSMNEDNADEEQPEAAPQADETAAPSEEDSEEKETIAQRIGEAATDGLFRLLKWLLLVAVFAGVIAALGVYWLYRNTTPDMMPQFTLLVDGQTVELASYDWNVPVVGNLFKRTYAETLHAEPVVLAKELENATPTFDLQPSDEYDTALSVKDSAGEEVFIGTLSDFEKFAFTENGDYTAKLVVTSQDGNVSGDALVTGHQVYDFTFGVDIRPTVRVNTQSITQGGVVSVSVTNIPEGETPSLVSGLSNAGFVKSTKGWIAYIPIPCEADTSKSYDIRVKTASYDQTITLTVRPRTSAYKDYSYEGALTGNYISVENTPDEVNKVLDICDPQVYWMASGFVQPFIHSITVTLPYGTTEYVGRTAAQRTSGVGSGRTSTCVIVSGHQGEVLISPADGRVVLAEDLGDVAGKTIVIEHGAGLKSIFYNLNKINVQEGDPVVQGQILGETNKVTVSEVRIGRVPVEPLSIWRGQCDAVKSF